jgi:hypothetical protein
LEPGDYRVNASGDIYGADYEDITIAGDETYPIRVFLDLWSGRNTSYLHIYIANHGFAQGAMWIVHQEWPQYSIQSGTCSCLDSEPYDLKVNLTVEMGYYNVSAIGDSFGFDIEWAIPVFEPLVEVYLDLNMTNATIIEVYIGNYGPAQEGTIDIIPDPIAPTTAVRRFSSMAEEDFTLKTRYWVVPGVYNVSAMGDYFGSDNNLVTASGGGEVIEVHLKLSLGTLSLIFVNIVNHGPEQNALIEITPAPEQGTSTRYVHCESEEYYMYGGDGQSMLKAVFTVSAGTYTITATGDDFGQDSDTVTMERGHDVTITLDLVPEGNATTALING